MIEYSTEKSSFLDRNKLCCQDVQSKLATLNYDCSGTCNAYGYNLLSEFERNRLKFNLNFIKHQRLGSRKALEYSGVEFKVNGFNSKYKFALGKSWVRRIFQSKELNDILPPPYYINSNSKHNLQFVSLVQGIFEKHNIDEFKLSGGELICRIHRADCDFIRLISDIEEIGKELK